MTKVQQKEFRQLLMSVRARVVGELKSIVEDTAKSPREASGDLSGYTVHMADMAADTYDREMSVNMASNEQEVLYQIDEALKRMEEGAYGDCQQCSKPITVSRLRAVPYASLCINCQREKEQKHSKK